MASLRRRPTPSRLRSTSFFLKRHGPPRRRRRMRCGRCRRYRTRRPVIANRRGSGWSWRLPRPFCSPPPSPPVSWDRWGQPPRIASALPFHRRLWRMLPSRGRGRWRPGRLNRQPPTFRMESLTVGPTVKSARRAGPLAPRRRLDPSRHLLGNPGPSGRRRPPPVGRRPQRIPHRRQSARQAPRVAAHRRVTGPYSAPPHRHSTSRDGIPLWRPSACPPSVPPRP